MLLYIHYPFCRSKCSYCGFCSRVWDEELEELYLSALLREVRFWGGRLDRRRITTLYIGGGTPSLMHPGILERLAEEIERHFTLADDLEFSLEANPDSLTPERARSLAGLGVNRVSLGFQSLEGVQLRLLERPHDAEQAFRSVDALRSAGVDNVGLDLLWGLPQQTPEDWLSQLKRVASLQPEHISCYCLTLEEGTRMKARVDCGELELPDEEQLEAMYLRGAELLESRGFIHYEIANFARPGTMCRHNRGYWQGRDYLGLGPSAVSTLQGRRWANPSDVSRYAEAVSKGELDRNGESLTRRQRIEELVLLSLRTREGLDLDRYRELTGEDLFRKRAEVLRKLRDQGLVQSDERRLWLTTRGMLLCDAITGALMPEDA